MPDEKEIAIIEKELEEIEHESTKLIIKISPFQEKLNALYAKKKSLLEEREKIWITTRKDDWAWILEENGSVSGERYKFRNKKIESLGLMSSGYYPEINQVSIKICLTKNDEESYKKTMAGLKVILPFIIPQNGIKRIAIFENTLSEGGIFSLEISETEIKLCFCRGRREETLKSFQTLEEAVKYIQENHWYRKMVKGKLKY